MFSSPGTKELVRRFRLSIRDVACRRRFAESVQEGDSGVFLLLFWSGDETQAMQHGDAAQVGAERRYTAERDWLEK